MAFKVGLALFIVGAVIIGAMTDRFRLRELGIVNMHEVADPALKIRLPRLGGFVESEGAIPRRICWGLTNAGAGS